MLTGARACLLAARAHGVVIVDGVYNAFKDDEGLEAECDQGRDMGMDGKTLIHPAQVAIANAAFAPSEDEIDLARRQIAAYRGGRGGGAGGGGGRWQDRREPACCHGLAMLAKARSDRSPCRGVTHV